MAIPKMRVAVVGCGSAGPAAALLLARAGHRVEIYERAPSLAPVGAGFLLQPTGLWVLAQLGLLDRVQELGARVSGLRSQTRHGRNLLHLRYTDLRPSAHGIGMHRATLLEVMARALAQAGIPIELGCEVTSAPRVGAQRRLDTCRGSRGPFDLVVVANGAQSGARAWSSARVRARRYPWGALWAIAPDLHQTFGDELFQVVDGAYDDRIPAHGKAHERSHTAGQCVLQRAHGPRGGASRRRVRPVARHAAPRRAPHRVAPGLAAS